MESSSSSNSRHGRENIIMVLSAKKMGVYQLFLGHISDSLGIIDGEGILNGDDLGQCWYFVFADPS